MDEASQVDVVLRRSMYRPALPVVHHTTVEVAVGPAHGSVAGWPRVNLPVTEVSAVVAQWMSRRIVSSDRRALVCASARAIWSVSAFVADAKLSTIAPIMTRRIANATIISMSVMPTADAKWGLE